MKTLKKTLVLGLLLLTLAAVNPILRYFDKALDSSPIVCSAISGAVCPEPVPSETYSGENPTHITKPKTDSKTPNTEKRPRKCPDCKPSCPDCFNAKRSAKKAGAPYGVPVSAAAASLKPIINVYKNMNDYYIEFFEKNIAKKPVVTKYSKEELTNMAKEYGVDFYKMRVMLIIEAIYQAEGRPKALGEIKKMPASDMIKLIYETKNKYFDSLPKEERARIEAEYKARKK